MTGSIIERVGTVIDDHAICHDDQPCTWERGDEIAGRRLDRRRSYAVIDGEVCELVTWSARCSGCSGEDQYEANGLGCRECGWTGRNRFAVFVPMRYIESDR